MAGKKLEEAVSRVLCAASPPRDGHFSTTDVPVRLQRPRPEGSGRAALPPLAFAGSPSYSVLLRVGFAVPRRSPGAR